MPGSDGYVPRGAVFRLRHDRTARGREQQGNRYAVALQSSALPLSTLIVAPTSRSAHRTSFRPVVTIAGNETAVLVEQLRAVDHSRLGDPVGRLDISEIETIDQALRDVLGVLVVVGHHRQRDNTPVTYRDAWHRFGWRGGPVDI